MALIKATSAPARCVIPPMVEYNGQSYKVTGITPHEVTIYKKTKGVRETDGRKKNFWKEEPKWVYCEKDIIGPFTEFDGYKESFDAMCPPNNTITSVVLPVSITSIGASAFRRCYRLKEINIPKGIKQISERAFSGCPSLECISLPEGIISIGKFAFVGCLSLKEIVIPSSVKTIDDSAFGDSIQNKNGLEIVNIINDEGNVIIHPDAFTGRVKINYLGKKAVPKPIQKPQTGKKEATSTSKAEPKVTGAKNVNGKDLTSFNLKNIITVDDFRKQFFEAFGANIYIYQGRSKVAGNVTLGECGLTTEGVFECKANFTVGYFIEKMQADFGLKVKVYTSDNWVAVLDGLTLESAGKVKKNATKADMEKLMVY